MHSTLISISEVVLHLSHGSFERPLSLGQNRDMILFSSQLISKACSIHHCLLGLLLRVFGLVKHIINLSLHCVKSTLNTSFLSISLLFTPFSRVKKSSCFFHLSLECISTAISKASLFSHLLADTGSLLIQTFSLTELSLVALDGLKCFIVCFVCMVQCNFKLIDISL